MIYKSLDEILAKTFFKVLKTKDVSLLLKDEEETPEKIAECVKAWEVLWCEYADMTQEQDSNERKIFDITKQITSLEATENLVEVLIRVLEFDKEPLAMQLLNKHGFRITEETYFEDLDRVKAEFGSMQHRIKNLLRRMPKKQIKQGEEEKPMNVEKLIIGYCAGIGYSKDSSTITMSEFMSIQEIFNEKIKAINKTNDNTKRPNNRRRN